MRKKTISLIMAVLMLTSLVAVTALAVADMARAVECPYCYSTSALSYYKVSPDSTYHRGYCGICERSFYESHNPRNCTKCR